MRGRAAADLSILFNGPSTDSLPTNTRPKLQRKESGLQGAGDKQKGTEISGSRTSAEAAAFSETKEPASVIVPFLSPPPIQPRGADGSQI